jgi:hypothetical protein
MVGGIHLPICNVVYQSGINFTKIVEFSAYFSNIDHITPSFITCVKNNWMLISTVELVAPSVNMFTVEALAR